jgi:hypothetical protein
VFYYTVAVAGDRQLRQKTKTSSVCATLYEVIDEIVFRKYQQNMKVGWKRSQYSTQSYLCYCHCHWSSKVFLPSSVERPLYSTDLSSPDFFLFALLKSVLKGQRFARTDEAAAKETRTPTELSINGFRECYQNRYERWEKCTTGQRNYFEQNVL